MRKFDDYLVDSFKYAFSDIKKGIVGGLLLSIPSVLAILTTILMAVYISKLNPYSMMFGFSIPKVVISVLIVGGLLVLVILMVEFIVNGYYVRTMKTTVDGENKLPDWGNIVELVRKGFLYWLGKLALGLMFFGVPVLPMLVGVAVGEKSPIAGLVLMGIGLILLLIFGIVYLFYSYLAEVNYSIKGFMGFFEYKKIFKMMSPTYIVLLVVVMIIIIIIEVIIQIPFVVLKVALSLTQSSTSQSANVLTASFIVDLISTAVSGFIAFFIGLFSKRAIALYYKDKIEEENQKSES
jgi:hypothetical protein